jgi:hypothetical protein
MKSETRAVKSRMAATAQFVEEWRDPDSLVRQAARERLTGGLWSDAVVEEALSNAFLGIGPDRARKAVGAFADLNPRQPLRTLIILPGNVIGPALHSAFRVAQTGAHAIVKVASSESALAAIIMRQWASIGEPLVGRFQVRHWKGGDLEQEANAVAEVENVIVFGSDATVEAVRGRLPAGKPFRGYGTRYSAAVVMPDADLTSAADGASVDICMFDQAGCLSPQTIYVAGDAARALRFAAALGAAMERTRRRLPRMPASREEAAASADVLRRAYITALPAATHGLSSILAGPDNNGAPDHLIIVEPQGPPSNHGFGRIVVVKPLESGMAPVFAKSPELLGVGGSLDEKIAIVRALWGPDADSIGDYADLGEMQRSVPIKPQSSELVDGRSIVA